MAQDLFEKALAAEGVSGQLAHVARSVYRQESGGGKNTKTSNAGAVGGMQIIPSTFASVADKGWDINDPLLNARAGIRYLKQLDKKAGGDPALTAAGYYGGPGAIDKARKGIAVYDPRNPRAPSTLEYGHQVASRIPGYQGNELPQATPSRSVPEQRPATFQVQAEQPVPEVAPVVVAASQVPLAMAEDDPWNQFLNRFRQAPGKAVVKAEDLAYGKGSGLGAELAGVAMPDFMSMLGGLQGQGARRSDFRSFSAWGTKV